MAGHTEDPRASDAGVGNLLGGDGFRGIGMSLVFVAHVFANADPPPRSRATAGPSSRSPASTSRWRRSSSCRAISSRGRSCARSCSARSAPRSAASPATACCGSSRSSTSSPTLVLLRFGLDGSIGPTPDNPSGERARFELVAGPLGLHVHPELHRRLGDAADRPSVVAGRRGRVLLRRSRSPRSSPTSSPSP